MRKEEMLEKISGCKGHPEYEIIPGWRFHAGPGEASRHTHMRCAGSMEFRTLSGFPLPQGAVVLHAEGVKKVRTDWISSNSFGNGVTWTDQYSVALLVWTEPCEEGCEREGKIPAHIHYLVRDRVK